MLRFAPSPTGPLHLGGLRTALINYITAKQLKGKVILRIEDTDQSRYDPTSLDDILRGLKWAGIQHDYGPDCGGPHAPYQQSKRLDLYSEYSKKLLESNRAYPCFCTPDELQDIKIRLEASKSHATYDRRCLDLPQEEVSHRLRAGQRHVIRFNYRVFKRPKSAIRDMIFTKATVSRLSLPTDPILVKSDGYPTYHLASVVDDHEMQVTHVIRGEEWLPSLTLHSDLYTSLGLTAPKFAHLPILLNPDGSKMSKRHGDVRVSDYIQTGWEPAAVRKWLLSAGWKGLSQAEDVTALLDDVEHEEPGAYSLLDIGHRRAILDSSLLASLNKQELSQEDPEAIVQRTATLCREAFPREKMTTEYVKKVITLLRGRFRTLRDIPVMGSYFFSDPDLCNMEAMAFRESIPDHLYADALNVSRKGFRRTSDFLQEDNSYIGPVKHFWGALRHALTGQKHGPALGDVVALLGQKRVIRSIELALDLDKTKKTSA